MKATITGAVAVALLLRCAVAPSSSAITPAELVERDLTLSRPTDIRWDDGEHVLISAAREGIARVSVARSDPPDWLPEWGAGDGIGTRYMYFGASESFMAAADLAFGLRWRTRTADGDVVNQPIEYVADLDVRGDRLLLAGLRRDDDGQLGVDGAFAWIGSMRDGVLRPVLPFTNRGLIENCAGFHLATVRFLRDGSFVIVPGAEPGVFVYDAQGRLQRTFDSEALNIATNCDLTRDEQSLLPTNAEARQGWINRHRIVDDVIELTSGPALIVRVRDTVATRWELVPLGKDKARPLPFTSTSPWAHVSADACNGRVAFLVADQTVDRDGGLPPRLIVWRP